MSSEADSAEGAEKWRTTTAILIALITVIGALVTWRASVSDDAAGDEDFAGVQATVNAEQIRTLNFVNGMEHYASYAAYDLYERTSNALEEAAKKHPQAKALERQATETADLAVNNLEMFPNQFMSRDRKYQIGRDLGSMWQDAIKQQDVDSEGHFAAADVFRAKTRALSLAVVVLSISLVLLTLVESVPLSLALPLLGLGAVTGLAGTVWAIMIEVGK